MKPFMNEKRRIERRVTQLSALSEKISSWRIGVFLASSFWLLVTGLTGSHWTYSVPAFLGVVGFLYLVWQQDRVNQTLILFRKRLEVAARTLAGAELDWAALPPLPTTPAALALPRYFSDLDLLSGSAFLRLLCFTSSTSGYRKLIEVFANPLVQRESILKRRELVQEVGRLQVLRRRFLVTDALWSGLIESDQILQLLNSALHTRKALFYFFAILSTQGVGWALFVFFSFKGGAPLFLFAGLATIVLYRMAGSHIRLLSAYSYGISLDTSLGKFSALSKVIERLFQSGGPRLKELLEPFSPERNPRTILRQASRVVGFLGVRQNYILHLALNLAFPWDYFWTLRLEQVRLKVRDRLPVWLEVLSDLEVYISLAEFEAGHPDFCVPEIKSEGEFYLRADDLAHPMIPPATRVGNPIEIGKTNRCWIITGSNMSGKSTFLRSIGINLLLANAGTVVCAKRFEFQPMALATSLRLNDSLEEGLSSFYAEVKQLKRILEDSLKGRPVFYLIDEVFRGTNNRERLIGSQAFVKHLAKTESCGLITTHDLELSRLAEQNGVIRNYHFKEDIEGNRMLFTYQLANGPCPTTNALKVMELAGLPID
jgi:hypothetical protein